MLKGSDIIYKKAIALDTGEQIEKIQDLIFDYRSNQLLGFLVDERGWFSNARVLPASGVQAINSDAVIAKSQTAVANGSNFPEIQQILESKYMPIGTEIMATDGRDLGTILDVYFDEETWRIEGYEVFGGLFADDFSGSSFVPALEMLDLGEQLMFVLPESADMMVELVGSIDSAMHAACHKLQQVGDTAIRATGSSYRSGATNYVRGSPLQHPRQTACEKLQVVLAPDAVELTKGLLVRQSVQTKDGIYIAAPGQIVTQFAIERSRIHHMEQQLIEAVGLTSCYALQSVLEQDSPGVKKPKESAFHLWECVEDTAGDLLRTSPRVLEEYLIQGLLGLSVNRVINDSQDNIILNAGELITREAIGRALHAGVLDLLLGSVQNDVLGLSPEHLGAPDLGNAALVQSC